MPINYSDHWALQTHKKCYREFCVAKKLHTSPRALIIFQRELPRFATLHRANQTLITAKNPGPQERTFDLKYLAAIHALRMNHTFD